MSITTPLGQVERDPDGLRLEFVRTLPTGIEDAWSAITESDRLARWFGSWSGDPDSGSVDVVMTAEDDETPQSVEIVECTRPTRLSVVVTSADGPWPLTVELNAVDDDTTTLVFTHRLAEPYDATGVGPGWHYYLDRLDAVVADDPVPEEFDPYMEDLSGKYPLPA